MHSELQASEMSFSFFIIYSYISSRHIQILQVAKFLEINVCVTKNSDKKIEETLLPMKFELAYSRVDECATCTSMEMLITYVLKHWVISTAGSSERKKKGGGQTV